MVASFEAWANLCRLIGFAIDKQRGLAAEGIEALALPDVDAGLEGVRWRKPACVRPMPAGSVRIIDRRSTPVRPRPEIAPSPGCAGGLFRSSMH